MAKEVLFFKMVGTGNDFVVIDNRKSLIGSRAKLAQKLCDRKRSIGADGVLLLEKSNRADFRMRIFNADGSEAEMCGNGIRCIAKFAQEKRITGNRFKIETLAGIIDGNIRGPIVKARMIDPKDMQLNFTVSVDKHPTKLSFVNTGVPHAVCAVSSIEKVDVDTLGPKLRHHTYFKPRGTNANFVQFLSDGSIKVRTYERGVEGETLSCGTGSTASALIAAALKGFRSPIKVRTASGDTLKIYFSKNQNQFKEVYLEGAVQKSFEGRVSV